MDLPKSSPFLRRGDLSTTSMLSLWVPMMTAWRLGDIWILQMLVMLNVTLRNLRSVKKAISLVGSSCSFYFNYLCLVLSCLCCYLLVSCLPFSLFTSSCDHVHVHFLDIISVKSAIYIRYKYNESESSRFRSNIFAFYFCTIHVFISVMLLIHISQSI